MELTPWQIWRTRAFLFAVGIKRRVTLGTRCVLVEGSRVLLVTQTYLPGWHFPGGGVEPGESAEEAAARELTEETGYRATGPMVLHGLFHAVDQTTNRDHVAVFVCRAFEKAADFRANREIAALQWFDAAALPADVHGPTRRRIEEIVGGRTPGARW